MDPLSIYAAVISTLVGAWAIYGVWRDRDHLKIDVRFSYIGGTLMQAYRLTTPNRRDIPVEGTRIVLTARNTGRRPISLDSGGFQYKGFQTTFVGDGTKQYPIVLAEGRSGETWVDLSALTESLSREGIPTRAYFRSESGRTYRGQIPSEIIQAIRQGS